MSTRIQKGDKCWVYIGRITKHYGVCVGHDATGEPMFIHNTAGHGRVTHATLTEFSGGRQVHVELRAQPGFEDDVVRRALDLVGTPYNLLTFNCEHFANLATTGSATSAQVTNGLVITLLGLLGVAGGVVLVNENGTAVDASSYRRDGSGRFAARRWW